jgi:S1-C subfamily serine protease
MRKISLILMLVIAMIFPITNPASAAVTWSTSSPNDSFNRPDLNSQYDLTYVSATIFDNEVDSIYIYLNFKNVPRINQYNDGSSFAAVLLDYNLDSKIDLEIYLSDVALLTDRTPVDGYVYRVSDKSYPKCDVSIFTNIDERKNWIGFEVSRKCIELPSVFSMQGYSDFIEDDGSSFDYAPETPFRVTLPGGTTSSGGTSTGSPTYELPSNVANESTEALNFSQAPVDLTLLSATLKPSVVTVKCGTGSGSGWSAKVNLSSKLNAEGFKSYVITNHHVIEDCLRLKRVSLLLNNGSTVDGTIISWNESSDVAGIVTKTIIPGLEWIGSSPKQGWWVGVIGSPLGQTGILTTGIVSSIDNNSGTFTMTAAINPGNSGGPVFDSTGRVLGLATSKNLISGTVLAEGSGNAHGVTLLCGTIVSCSQERNPWGAVSKFSAAIEAEKIRLAAEAKAAADKIIADAKAAAEAKVAADKIIADAKAEADRILAAAKAASAKKTITCVKGKLTKKVTAVKPVCPSGYKKK